MVRNEIDILPAFLQHVHALFDHVVLMDHGSVDGSKEIMALAVLERKNWRLWHVKESGYYQEAFCGFAMRWLFQHTDAEVVMFLDADEFVSVHSRTLFDAICLASWEQAFIASFPWNSCLPLRPGAAIYHGCEHWRKKGAASGSKIAVPRTVYDKHPNLRPGLGNHAALLGEKAMPAQVVGKLWHFPLRSVEQFKRKIVLGSLAVAMRGEDLSGSRHHWLEACRNLAHDGLDEMDMLGMAASYSERDAAHYRLTYNDLTEAGYSKTALQVANKELNVRFDAPVLDPWEAMAAALIDFHQPNGRLLAPRDVRVSLTDNNLQVVSHG